MAKIFIDGSSGTTGLRIRERLSERKDIKIITIDENLRHDTEARKNAINTSDISFLCLPDDAAKEAVSLVDNNKTVIIDTSTAHRTNNEWTYGFPEISDFRERIKTSKRIANPGCHASGFIALVSPLVSNGLLRSDANLSCFSLTGYSGGGKKMISEYESGHVNTLLNGPRQYALSQNHKHLGEMKKICKIKNYPIFCPIVAPFFSGMEVTVPVFKSDLNGTFKDIEEIYSSLYNCKTVHYDRNSDENGFMSASAFSGRDDMQISIFGNDDRILLISRFDNLGKGASGSAIQNMNIILGTEETKGLITEV